MKIFTFDDEIGAVEYVKHSGDDLTVVNAARVSFGAEKKELDDKDIKLINYLMSHGHTSPFEHCNVTFRFVVPLFIRSQHHRHRTWSYNEISRRYTSVDMQFYEPESFRTQHKSNRQASNPDDLQDPLAYKDFSMVTCSEMLQNRTQDCFHAYEVMLDAGVCREQARGVLPQNLYTQYYGTANLHNILKFIALRVHDGAQWEIQQVAKACLAIAKKHYPISVSAFIKKSDMETT